MEQAWLKHDGSGGSTSVTPAKAGVQGQAVVRQPWIPAFAGMTIQFDPIVVEYRALQQFPPPLAGEG
jgi:hypothetical protein